jgi:hypothetical protein
VDLAWLDSAHKAITCWPPGARVVRPGEMA